MKGLKRFAALGLTLALTGCGTSGQPIGAATEVIAADKEETTEAASTETSTETTSDTPTEKQKIVIATSGSPNPFTFVGEDDVITGYDVEAVRAVFEKLPQYEYEIVIADWSSIFAGLDSDKYQVGVNNISYNPERAEKYLYTKALLSEAYVIVVREDNESIKSFEDLLGKTTEVDPDTSYAATLQSYNDEHPDNPIIVNYSDEDLLIALQNIESGKYDFYLVDDALFSYYKNEYGLALKSVTIDPERLHDITPPYSYILVSKGNDQLVEDINGALEELVKDGTLSELSLQFFGTDLSPVGDYQ